RDAALRGRELARSRALSDESARRGFDDGRAIGGHAQAAARAAHQAGAAGEVINSRRLRLVIVARDAWPAGSANATRPLDSLPKSALNFGTIPEDSGRRFARRTAPRWLPTTSAP